MLWLQLHEDNRQAHPAQWHRPHSRLRNADAGPDNTQHLLQGSLVWAWPLQSSEWGTIISENMLNIRYYPYLGIAPAACICLAVMAVNFIGDGLRDAFDPRN